MSGRVVLSIVLVVGLLGPGGPAPAEYRETVDVERIVIDARVVDLDGHPVTDLTCEDFVVKVAGRKAPVTSCELLSASGVPREAQAAGGAGAESYEKVDDVTPHGGRLIVLVFQRHTHHSRMPGMLLMRQLVMRRVESMHPDDRIAVLSFDSRMWLVQDFTSDPETVRAAVHQAVIPDSDREQIPPDQPPPSLARWMDPDGLKNAATLDDGMYELARALEAIPGPKTVFLFGHGSGTFAGGAVTHGPEYDGAIRRLAEARAPVFSFDVTRADYHTLEGSLETLAYSTGGTYSKTHLFARLPLDWAWRSMGAFYELEVVKPDLPEGRHSIKVRVRDGRDLQVFARNFYDES